MCIRDRNKIVNEYIKLANIPPVTEVFFVDRYGSTIYSNNNDDYGKTIFELNRRMSPLLEIYNQFITTKSGSDDYTINNNGDRIEYILSWDSFTIESRKFILTISTPKSYINQNLEVVSEWMILLNIVITAVSYTHLTLPTIYSV